MNYNLEQINIIIEKMQKQLEAVTAISIIAFIASLLLLLGLCLFSYYENKPQDKSRYNIKGNKND